MKFLRKRENFMSIKGPHLFDTFEIVLFSRHLNKFLKYVPDEPSLLAHAPSRAVRSQFSGASPL